MLGHFTEKMEPQTELVLDYHQQIQLSRAGDEETCERIKEGIPTLSKSVFTFPNISFGTGLL